MPFDLAAMAARTRRFRQPQVVIRDIAPPAVLATDFYRACYMPIIQEVEAATPRILAAYERALAEMVTDSAADVEEELSALQRTLQALVLALTPRLRSWALQVETWHRGKWRGAVLSATGVDLGTMLGPSTARRSLEQTIAWNTGLIRDIGDQARQRIGTAVFSGLTERQPPRVVAKEISEAAGMGRARARRIAADQLNKLASELAEERRREAGIKKWKWRHSGKKHPRVAHKARDGKVYSDKNPPPEMPGRLPYCGCRSQAVLEFS